SLGAPRERVHYIPNGPGIPLEAVTPAERAAARARLGLGERPTVLVYSRLFEFDTARLVAVLAGIRAAVDEAAVLLVGAGLFERDAIRFREQLDAAGLVDGMIDAGWVELKELPAVLAAADVGLYLMDDTLLNRTKCPVKLADMLAVGVPVVAEAVGQVPEYVVHRETGLLRASGDVEGLAADLVALLEDAALRRRLGQQAASHIERHFSWQRLAATALEAYRG